MAARCEERGVTRPQTEPPSGSHLLRLCKWCRHRCLDQYLRSIKADDPGTRESVSVNRVSCDGYSEAEGIAESCASVGVDRHPTVLGRDSCSVHLHTVVRLA